MLTNVTWLVPGQKEKKKAKVEYTRPTTLANIPHRPNLHGPNRIGFFRMRRRRSRTMGTMYEASTLATLRETIALKAVEEPILMRASSRLIATVTAME